MNFETISRKHLNQLELESRQLLSTIRSAKLQDEPLVEALRELAEALEKYRHEAFDSANSEYHTY